MLKLRYKKNNLQEIEYLSEKNTYIWLSLNFHIEEFNIKMVKLMVWSFDSDTHLSYIVLEASQRILQVDKL